MASKTKAANAAAAIANGVASTVLTIPEFCHDKKMSEGHYRLLRKAGLGPKEIPLGLRAKRITMEAAAEWDVKFSQPSTQDKLKKFLQEQKEQRLRRKQQREQSQ